MYRSLRIHFLTLQFKLSLRFGGLILFIRDELIP